MNNEQHRLPMIEDVDAQQPGPPRWSRSSPLFNPGDVGQRIALCSARSPLWYAPLQPRA